MASRPLTERAPSLHSIRSTMHIPIGFGRWGDRGSEHSVLDARMRRCCGEQGPVSPVKPAENNEVGILQEIAEPRPVGFVDNNCRDVLRDPSLAGSIVNGMVGRMDCPDGVKDELPCFRFHEKHGMPTYVRTGLTALWQVVQAHPSVTARAGSRSTGSHQTTRRPSGQRESGEQR